jgi:Mitochondrial carrier protein
MGEAREIDWLPDDRCRRKNVSPSTRRYVNILRTLFSHAEPDSFDMQSAASTVTYPLQVIKARMQQRSESLEFTPEGDIRAVRRDYAGLIGTARKMWQGEGISAFFKGCLPNAIRVAPGAAITFVVYEAIMDWR